MEKKTAKKSINESWVDETILKKTKPYDLSKSCFGIELVSLESKKDSKQIIEAYRYFNGKLIQIFDSIPLPIMVHDASFRITRVNSAYLRLVNKKCDEIINQYYGKFFPIDDGKPPKCVCKLGDKTIYHSREFKIYSFPMEDPTAGCYQFSLHVFEDITKLKLAEALLDVKAQQLHKIKELEQEANLDPLTKLRNRRALYSILSTECDRAVRYKRPLSLLFMDIDNFKEFNDTYGHSEGDKVLIGLANLLTDNLRSVDLEFRFGGEEFLLILPETNINGAKKVADRIRSLFKKIKFHPEKANKTVFKTLSIGVAEYYAGLDKLEFIDMCDKAMYVAKQKGKDKTCFLKKGKFICKE